MNRPFVEQLRIQNYGCVYDVSLQLTPLHALIGPSDGGKTTVLRALSTLSFLLGAKLPESALRAAIAGSRSGPLTRLDASTADTTWRVDFQHGGQYAWSSFARGEDPHAGRSHWREFGSLAAHKPAPSIVQAMEDTFLARFDPQALRSPQRLITDKEPLRFFDERGAGLPSLYDALVVRNVQAYMEINQALSRRFPNIKNISLTTPTPQTRGIGVKLKDDTFIAPELMSEGVLYYLGLMALKHITKPAILLVEAPENGLHPARVAETVHTLREMSTSTQVIMTTYSPLVVNELRPDEVTLITRTAGQGTLATLMKNTVNFEERSKGHPLGEVWQSHANGDDEGPLVRQITRPW